MQSERFINIVDEQIEVCRTVLGAKAQEYAPSKDKLANFRSAANLRKCNLKQALAGMMIKHTVSLYDMLESESDFSEAQWNEKVTDHLNYLFLLQAILVEERESAEYILAN